MKDYGKLSLTEINAKKEAALSIVNNPSLVFWVILLFVLILILTASLIVIHHSMKESRMSKFLISMNITLLFVSGLSISSIFAYVDGAEKEYIHLVKAEEALGLKIYEERKLLIEDFTKKETSSIAISEISTKIHVPRDHCPSIKGTDACIFMEFVSEGENKQAFVPFTKEMIDRADYGGTMNYYQLEKEDLDLYESQFSLSKKKLNDIYIDSNSLIIGDSMSN